MASMQPSTLKEIPALTQQHSRSEIIVNTFDKKMSDVLSIKVINQTISWQWLFVIEIQSVKRHG